MTFLQWMRRGLVRGLAGALLLASVAGCQHVAESTVWSVKGERNTVYLAGSVHALQKDHAQLPPELELAYGKVNAIVMEVDLDDLNPLEAVQFLTTRGTLPGSQTLSDVIGADKYSKVAALATSIELPEPAIAKLEPWAAAMVLTQMALLKTGFDPQLGIDMQIMERARTDGKTIDGLETLEEQLGIFDSRSEAEQIKFLVDAADDIPQMQDDLRRLVAAWRAGDMDALDREFREERAKAPALYDALLGERNRKWLPKIEALLAEDRDYLVVVGTLHFVGSDGLLELLNQSGHKAKSLPASAARASR